MASPILIRNIYYILLYAWQNVEEARPIDVGRDDSPELQDLLAKVLIQGVRHLMRRGLERSYQTTLEEMPVFRGRLDIGETILCRARQSPNIVCLPDSLSPDTLANRILKTTLFRASKIRDLDRDLARELRHLTNLMADVSLMSLRLGDFHRVQITRNNGFYGFLLKVCRLMEEGLMPDEDGTGFSFIDFLRDETRMPEIFEAFLRNFYSIEQSDYSVDRLQVRWDFTTTDAAAAALMPLMNTDIHLSNSDCAIIIDAKYYPEWMQKNFDRPKLRSGHLYQIFSYLKNAEARGYPYGTAKGILIYPAAGNDLDVAVTIQNHPVRAVTIDLQQPWQQIKDKLLSLIDDQDRVPTARSYAISQGDR